MKGEQKWRVEADPHRQRRAEEMGVKKKIGKNEDTAVSNTEKQNKTKKKPEHLLSAS